MRGADSGPLPALNALPALWVGLLYDQTALDAAWDLVKDWTVEDHDYLRSQTPRTGLATKFQGRPLVGARRARWSRSPMPACAPASGSMRMATTRRSIWRRSIARWRAALRRPTSCWPSGRASGSGSFAPLFRDYAY